MPASPHPSLFNPDTTLPQTCQHCQAMLLPGQHRTPTCAHDLDPDRRRRPRGCLNRPPDPQHAPIPY